MKAQLKTLKIIHLALCAGVIFAYTILYNFTSIEVIFNITADTTEDYIFIFLPIAAFLVSNLMYKFLLKTIDKNGTQEAQFMSFQTASLARWAVLEGSAFIVLFIKPEFIISGIVIIIYLLILMPTEDKFKNDLNLLKQ